MAAIAMRFETDRLFVRRFAAGEADLFYRINGDPEVVKHIRPAKTREDSDAFFTENLAMYQDGSVIGRHGIFIKSTGDFAGTFSLLYLSGEVDIHIGYALVPGAWGRGFATEVTRRGITHFFDKADKETLYAITSATNVTSQKVLLKAGMQPSGQITEHAQVLERFSVSREQVQRATGVSTAY